MADKVQTKFMPGTANDGNGFPENYVNNIFVDINPTVDTNGDVDLNDLTTGKWAWLAGGINTVTPSANETTANDAYYDGGGFTETEVTGKQVQLAVSGNRKVGDPAQDFVAGKFWQFGNAVKTRVIWIENGVPVVAKATLTNVVPTGGAANAKQTFSFTIAFNGRPKIPEGQLKMTLTTEATIYSADVDSSVKPDGNNSVIKAIVADSVPGAKSGADSKQTTSNPAGQGTPTSHN